MAEDGRTKLFFTFLFFLSKKKPTATIYLSARQLKKKQPLYFIFLLHNNSQTFIQTSNKAQMATSKGTVHFDRFTDIAEEPRKLLQPIEGYKDLELVSLEEAINPIEKFCPDVRRRAYIAKNNCDEPKDGLTQDESASIFLYTTEWAPSEQCLYVVLNGVLRSKNRHRLITPWLLYLKLILTALFKLRSCSTTIWRGVRLDLRRDYEVGKTYTWWGFSSCTKTMAVLESDLFLGQEGKRTMFSIECFNGKKIRAHSSIEEEDEILLLPGTQFVVESHFQPSKKDPDLIIIQLKQIEPPFVLLEEPSSGITKKDNSSSK